MIQSQPSQPDTVIERISAQPGWATTTRRIRLRMIAHVHSCVCSLAASSESIVRRNGKHPSRRLDDRRLDGPRKRKHFTIRCVTVIVKDHVHGDHLSSPWPCPCSQCSALCLFAGRRRRRVIPRSARMRILDVPKSQSVFSHFFFAIKIKRKKNVRRCVQLIQIRSLRALFDACNAVFVAAGVCK